MHIISLFFVFTSLISDSYNIGVDYYDDYKTTEDENNNYTDVTESIERRFAQNKANEKEVKSVNFISDQTDTRPFFYTTIKYEQSSPINNTVKESYSDIPTRNKLTQVFHQTLSNQTPEFNFFKDYVYIYDDDESKILRQDNVSKQIQKETPVNDTAHVKLKDHSVQFYNLEPAVDRDIFKEYPNDTDDESVWYVPENYPCWELPLLYGELGQRKKKSEVFLILGGRLRNVVEPDYNETSFKSQNSQRDQIVTNRWCGVLPCYGDHTLCLFPDDSLSKLCEKGYTVEVPSILDQIALVNTINSMRNRVASRESDRYYHLPSAANMKEINYDYDLQKVSEAWLRQCLPGPAPCSALEGNSVSHLECTKYADFCCVKSPGSSYICTPKTECFISPIIGCIHVWFWSGGKNIQPADVQCGRTSVNNFNAVQLLWAKTMKIGCAYGKRSNGDIRVVCNFAPGAPYFLDTKLFCGVIAHKYNTYAENRSLKENFVSSLATFWNDIQPSDRDTVERIYNSSILSYFKISDTANTIWGVQSLNKIYKEGWVREFIHGRRNGTKGMIARLVTKYTFIDESEARCDTNDSIYISGEPGSLCVERGRRYNNLCYDFRDPTPGYRSVAVAAPIALFSLILYDLFSGVVRQSN
ncbi:unnamed protein product [Leptosia nina]|uniref:SCP domain-containing protein n=1 Tax=Leptosia nina TaxID=320188 RepID=A0AAV1IWU3_9NEOP